MKDKFFILAVIVIAFLLGGSRYNPSSYLKIDSQAVDGLLGTNNSLAYKVHEIEQHFHNTETWIGLAADADATHVASEVGKAGVAGFTETGFVVTSGNDDWSDNPTLVIGTAETTILQSSAKFDMHDVMAIATSDEKEIFYVRLSWGAGTSAESISAGDYTTFPIWVQDTAKDMPIIPIMMPRVASSGINVWMWVFKPDENDKTVTFILGLHEYVG